MVSSGDDNRMMGMDRRKHRAANSDFGVYKYRDDPAVLARMDKAAKTLRVTRAAAYRMAVDAFLNFVEKGEYMTEVRNVKSLSLHDVQWRRTVSGMAVNLNQVVKRINSEALEPGRISPETVAQLQDVIAQVYALMHERDKGWR